MANESGDPAPDLSVLILHGWQNRRPPGHWHRWLADTLTAAGHQVVYPQLPEPDEPVLSDWLAVAGAAFAELRGRERVVVAHSLGCPTWLHLAAAGEVRADRLALVVPPSPVVLAGFPEVAAFAVDPATAGDAPTGATRTVLVSTDNDPYDPERSGARLAERIGAESVVLPGQAHINPDSGYGEWPEFLAWVLDPAVGITARGAGAAV